MKILPFVGILSLVVVALAGCETTQVVEPPAAPAAPTYVRLAPHPPPTPLFEIPDTSDNPRKEIWRPGYWAYEDGEFYWVSGKLIPRPSPTAVWAADMWVQHSYGWGFLPGHWQ